MEPIDFQEAHPTLSRGALRHELVKQFLSEIFQGKLPSGSRMIVMKLAERFGLSSTPVREALVELEAIGMIRLVHNRGAVVNPFGPTELREIYQIRRILESEAARIACGKMSEQSLQALQAEMAALAESPGRGKNWSEREMAADRSLHTQIASACACLRLAAEIRRYDTLVQAVRESLGGDRKAQMQALDDHQAIIEALRRGQADEAGAAMARHIDNSARLAQQVMFPDAKLPAD